jgi:hypothetical protein
MRCAQVAFELLTTAQYAAVAARKPDDCRQPFSPQLASMLSRLNLL